MESSKKFLWFLLTVWSRPKVDKFSKFWEKISQKWLQRIYFRAPRIFSRKIRSCCCMTKRYVKGFGQQLQNKRVREWYVPTIFRHSVVENVGHLWSEQYIFWRNQPRTVWREKIAKLIKFKYLCLENNYKNCCYPNFSTFLLSMASLFQFVFWKWRRLECDWRWHGHQPTMQTNKRVECGFW